MDDEVKRIFGLVRKYGDKRKTFFIFTSDNGLQLGAHRIEFKDYLYQEGERVPLVIRGPGFPQNADPRSAGFQHRPRADHHRPDQFAAGAGDGRDLPPAPCAGNPLNGGDRALLEESFDLGEFGVRQGPWAYNPWNDGDEELYNLDDDPYELTNLLHGPGASNYAAIRDQLATRLAQLKTCAGDSCR